MRKAAYLSQFVHNRDSQNKTWHMHTAAPEDKEINKMHREISNDTLNPQNYTMMVCNTNESED